MPIIRVNQGPKLLKLVEEKYLMIYICMFISFSRKRGEGFSCFIQKGGECFWGEEFLSYACLSPCLCIYICLILYTLLNILLFIIMHELRGSFYEA